MKPKTNYSQSSAFTFVDLLGVCAAVFICALIVFPALGRTHNQNSLTESINNLRQLTSAWLMYPTQNGGRLVYSFPNVSANTNTWCQGTAESGGTPGSYTYGGADTNGILRGDLWPYVRNFSCYKCPADNRLASQAAGNQKNQVILRSYSVNSFMAGETFGTSEDTTVLTPSTWDIGNYRFFVKENQLTEPSGLFVFIEEDGASINDGMLFVDIGGSRRFLDLPTRHHSNSYPLTFADGHAETYRLQQTASLNWTPGDTGGLRDWEALTNVTTTFR